jgi:NAD(P)-dependent dehydrogenase (short-subunit alcohol dehydrogenase family)
MRVETRVAIVTGASQGIGAGLAAGFRDRGWSVVANSRSVRPADDAGVVTVAGDISDPAVARRITDAAIGHFGRIDTLVNNAGIFIGKPFVDYSEADFSQSVAVNLAGFFHLSQGVARQMLRQGRGHIVNITTTHVEQPQQAIPSAVAALTKGGLDAVTRALAIEFAAKGIRVNAISPGVIKTPMSDAADPALLATMQPMPRLGEVREIVDAVLYLEHAEFVTGHTLHVDGGAHAGRW